MQHIFQAFLDTQYMKGGELKEGKKEWIFSTLKLSFADLKKEKCYEEDCNEDSESLLLIALLPFSLSPSLSHSRQYMCFFLLFRNILSNLLIFFSLQKEGKIVNLILMEINLEWGLKRGMERLL